jgi:non-heme chloroperoxidase
MLDAQTLADRYVAAWNEPDATKRIELTGKPSAELIPGCRLLVYEGAPHGLMFTHMDQLHADILRFMRET